MNERERPDHKTLPSLHQHSLFVGYFNIILVVLQDYEPGPTVYSPYSQYDLI